VFQEDERWTHVQFGAGDTVVQNVIKFAVQFEPFPDKEVVVRDLIADACMPEGS